MLENAQSYLGQSNIGTNSSDTGECVGLYNKVVLNVSGILYPLQGAQGAKDLITCTNTRPDLFQQIKNNPNDPNQLPQVGDWIVWGSTWGGGYGHVACAKTVSKDSFTSIEQNYVYHKVTEQWHDWNGVIGWVRYTAPAPVDPCADVKAQLNAANSQITALNAQVTNLTNECNSYKLQLTTKQAELDQANAQVADLQAKNADLEAQLDAANKKIRELEAQIANGGNIVINFNFFGQILWNVIKTLGTKK